MANGPERRNFVDITTDGLTVRFIRTGRTFEYNSSMIEGPIVGYSGPGAGDPATIAKAKSLAEAKLGSRAS